MTINDNTMNPVPFWAAKSQWQCKQPTYHGAMAWPIVAKGTFPATMLTVGSTNIPTSTPTVTVNGASYSGTRTSLDVFGNLSVIMTINQVKLDIYATSTEDVYTAVYSTKTSLATTWTRKDVDANGLAITKQMLIDGVTLVDANNTVSLYVVVSSGMTVTTTMTMALYDYNDTLISTKSVSCNVKGVPQALRTSTRYATIFINTQTFTGTLEDKVHYVKLTDANGTIRYSEPFMWLTDLSDYTLVTYRRSEPIVTTENYMRFDDDGTEKTMTMYISGLQMMPPFQFDADVVDIDGRKYAEKLVSYRKDRLEFMCYEAFVDAIRLLWHCDIRYVAGKRIDYMQPPTVDWGTDNHLCNVVLEFESDTLVQTNGIASAYIDSSDYDHTAYDASYDASFA